jgi:hypothetical protein
VSDVTSLFDANADSDLKSNKDFQTAYIAAGGTNAILCVSDRGRSHVVVLGSAVAGPKPDLIATLNAESDQGRYTPNRATTAVCG